MKLYKIIFLIIIGNYFIGCDFESKNLLDVSEVSKIEDRAKVLFKQNKNVDSYIDSLILTTKNKNLVFYLNIISIKFNKENSETSKLEKYKALVNESFLVTSDPITKFKIRSEIASILMQGENIYPGINQMLIGLGEIEKEPEKYGDLIVGAYKKIIGAKSLSRDEKEYYANILTEYIPKSEFNRSFGHFYDLGYYSLVNQDYDSAIQYFRESINLTPDSSISDSIVIKDLLEKHRNNNWANVYPALIACYPNQPDTAYKYIEKVDELFRDSMIESSSYYSFKLHLLVTLISIGDYELALLNIDELVNHFGDNCWNAYNMTVIYEQKSRIHKLLKQNQKHAVALKKWNEYASCPRTHEFFDRKKLESLNELIDFYSMENNYIEAYHYQTMKMDLLEKNISNIESQRERSKVWSNFELEVEKNEDMSHRIIHEFERSRFYLLLGITLITAAVLFYILYLNISIRSGRMQVVEKQNMLDETNRTLENSNILIREQNDDLNNQKTQIETKLKENLLFINLLSTEIDEIVEHISDIESKKDISMYHLKNRIQRLISRKMTDEINIQFQEHHKYFVQKLCHFHPSLTSNNIRLCILLKLNLSTKEISKIEGKSIESIKVGRSRLRNKFKIQSKSVTLSAHLNGAQYNRNNNLPVS